MLGRALAQCGTVRRYSRSWSLAPCYAQACGQHAAEASGAHESHEPASALWILMVVMPRPVTFHRKAGHSAFLSLAGPLLGSIMKYPELRDQSPKPQALKMEAS